MTKPKSLRGMKLRNNLQILLHKLGIKRFKVSDSFLYISKFNNSNHQERTGFDSNIDVMMEIFENMRGVQNAQEKLN